MLYWKAPTVSELHQWNMKATDFPEPHVEVWEESWDALNLFGQYSTQWRVGMNGPTGLDFNVFHHALDRKGVTGDEFDDMMRDIRIIELAALAKIHEDK